MTIANWLELAKQKIVALDAELILLFGLKAVLPPQADRSYLAAHLDVGISQASWEKLDKMLERRMKGEPLAYILGIKEFYGREFKVSPEVLIPRPETENLVDLTLELIGGPEGEVLEKALSDGSLENSGRKTSKKWQILEIGTGSGCIAITLALEMRQRGTLGAVTAVDVSEAALDKARENTVLLGAEVKFLLSNLLENVENVGNFDVLVANLPYVDANWEWLDRKGLDFEPSLALYAEEGGLVLYRRLFEQLEGRVKWLVLEADPCQHEVLVQLAEKNGYRLDKIDGFGVRLKAE